MNKICWLTRISSGEKYLYDKPSHCYEECVAWDAEKKDCRLLMVFDGLFEKQGGE